MSVVGWTDVFKIGRNEGYLFTPFLSRNLLDIHTYCHPHTLHNLHSTHSVYSLLGLLQSISKPATKSNNLLIIFNAIKSL